MVIKTQPCGKNIFGSHSYFPYYGQAHLYVNLLHYIKDGINRGEFVYISMELKMYRTLLNILNSHGVNTKAITRFPLERMMFLFKNKGKKALQVKIDTIINHTTLGQGYRGLRGIVDLSYLIQKTSKYDVLNYEQVRSDVINEGKISILCLCDYEDYMGDQCYIDDDVMEQLQKHHSHKLFQFSLQPTEPNLGSYDIMVANTDPSHTRICR